ncbi:hypothetical protein BQ8420_30625 [Nocardiopsis sp. JB363]|nr:hypothetical protein BQ8420_30625 [Nocardiopsis sp. JB363]
MGEATCHSVVECGQQQVRALGREGHRCAVRIGVRQGPCTEEHLDQG